MDSIARRRANQSSVFSVVQGAMGFPRASRPLRAASKMACPAGPSVASRNASKFASLASEATGGIFFE